MGKSKQTVVRPVMLGKLNIGDKFIFNGKIWEVKQQEYSKPRDPASGMARCKQINTPVVSNLVRSNYVVPV